jgi:hypothetical protein
MGEGDIRSEISIEALYSHHCRFRRALRDFALPFFPGIMAFRAQATNIYNNYISSLPLRAIKGGGRAVGLNHPTML